jgi:hypothetical protein
MWKALRKPENLRRERSRRFMDVPGISMRIQLKSQVQTLNKTQHSHGI